ncbi:transmembrane sensor [Pedobacter africanus]|uniref:Uncharacterized protein n=1 Tax=Pedobacter africanus TaxID=151894 RepID=A0ACC6KQQ8_9SPHI|nr:FecR domain-containing protein [Pedobacter africanus]MDR6781477.1 hypothetical protein [Pedobacter africanus]
MNKKKAKALLIKYENGELLRDEQLRLNQWYLEQAVASKETLSEEALKESYDYLKNNLPVLYGSRTAKLWPRLVGIAAAVTAIIVGTWFYIRQTAPTQKATAHSEITLNDIAPGKQGATLTLANGKKIRLGNAANGELAKEAGLVITKTANGQLIYEVEKGHGELSKVNTLTTARGETYEVRLPDGTLVWLNAASSLSYATKPNERGERKVKLEGEGYFEVAKDKDHPFVVQTRGQEVEVLGTHFNISSYADDEVEKTTLVEGSIRLSSGGRTRLLKPGQQANIKGTGISVEDVDTDQAIAWKNKEFMFQSESIEGVMKAVERWYNVEVIYVGARTKERFTGGVSRYDNVSKVLDIVEFTGASHFKITGRKIYVSK